MYSVQSHFPDFLPHLIFLLVQPLLLTIKPLMLAVHRVQPRVQPHLLTVRPLLFAVLPKLAGPIARC
jgi:hypothetical protein